MNERIRAFAEQAEMSANKGDHVDVKIMMEKFAELIVRECARVADINQAENMDWNISEIILEHFGVEE